MNHKELYLLKPGILFENLKYKLNKDLPSLKKEISQARNGGKIRKMLFINQKIKTLYVSVPKAANNTVRSAISVNSRLTPAPGISDKKLQHILSSDDWFRFTFVRNPFTRIVSAYKNKILFVPHNTNFLKKIEWTDTERLPTIEEFIERVAAQDPARMDWHWKPQHLLVLPDFISLDFIGKIENYNQDIEKIADRYVEFGLPRPQLGNIQENKSSDHKIEKKRTTDIKPEAIALIQKVYEKDFETFGYDIEDISVI